MLYIFFSFWILKLPSHFAPQAPVLPNKEIKNKQQKLYLNVINKKREKWSYNVASEFVSCVAD